MLENIREVIVWIVGAVSLVCCLVVYRDKKRLERTIKSQKFGCRYNDRTGCSGSCFNICSGRKECNWCCGGDPKLCGGLVEEGQV